MGLAEAVKTCLSKYADFSGRARRSEYWFFSLGILLAYIACFVVTVIVRPLGGLLIIVLILGAIIPGIAVTVRRLHDTGRSGWWYFIAFVPLVGGIILLVFLCTDSGPDNQYGPNPKGAMGGMGGMGGMGMTPPYMPPAMPPTAPPYMPPTAPPYMPPTAPPAMPPTAPPDAPPSMPPGMPPSQP